MPVSHPTGPVVRHAAGHDGPPPTGLAVEIVRAAQVTDIEEEIIRDQLTRIWQREGVVIAFVPERTASKTAGHLRLVLSDASIRVPPSTSGLCALGSIRFVQGIPASTLVVSVASVRDWVRRARPGHSPGLGSLLAARVMGRVAAHEIGHYLLGDSSHRPAGLMRASFDGALLLGPHLEPFAPPPGQQLLAGVARAGEGAAR
jgi:hypothetical protein